MNIIKANPTIRVLTYFLVNFIKTMTNNILRGPKMIKIDSFTVNLKEIATIVHFNSHFLVHLVFFCPFSQFFGILGVDLVLDLAHLVSN